VETAGRPMSNGPRVRGAPTRRWTWRGTPICSVSTWRHTRTIALEDWQQEIVDDHPGPFLRGLIHSDGCRMTNWT
jgi:hypothetical protein